MIRNFDVNLVPTQSPAGRSLATRRAVHGLAAAGTCLVLAACGASPVAPAADTPVSTPGAWTAGASRDGEVGGWIRQLGDSTLEALVDEALAGNPDFAASAARVSAAAAQARITGATLWPRADLELGGSRSKRSSASGFSISNPISDNRSLDLGISWEADLWGRASARTRASGMDAAAAAADHAAARLSLAGNVARSWYALLTARQQLALARETARNFADNEEVIEERVVRGLNPVLDLRLIRASVASARSQVQAAEREADATLRGLEVLLGRYPSASLESASALPEPGDLPAAGIPASLVERRPDLRAARLRLAARNENLRDSNRNLLPGLLLSASGGTSSVHFRNLLDSDFLVWSVAASLTQPLFEGGRLRAEREQAAAVADEAVANYAGAALVAFQEVEAALHADQALANEVLGRQVAERESIEAERLAADQYAAGLVDIITLLEARRRAVDARSALIAVRNQRLQNRIDLYLALGGDPHATESELAATGMETP